MITQMIKLKCCIHILWSPSTTFYEKKKSETVPRQMNDEDLFLALLHHFSCSWHVLEKAANALQLVQYIFVQARLQRRINYGIDMKTDDGTEHIAQTSSPPAQCLSHLLTSPPFSYIFKNTRNREKGNKDLSKVDIPRTSNEG